MPLTHRPATFLHLLTPNHPSLCTHAAAPVVGSGCSRQAPTSSSTDRAQEVCAHRDCARPFHKSTPMEL